MRRVFLLPVVLCTVASLSPGGQSPPAGGRLTIESLIDIKHPSLATWSPDATQMVFVWERAAFINTCCSKAMSCWRPTTGAASVTVATGGKVCTWMSAARMRPTR